MEKRNEVHASSKHSPGTMSETQLKPDKDYKETLDHELPKISAMKLEEAIEALVLLEKQTRQASDMNSTARILVKIVDLAFEQREWETLNEQVQSLSKKHGQLKGAITKMVQSCITFLDSPVLADATMEKQKLALIETLRNVTEGKIYVEVERARLTRTLSKFYEEQGDVKKAQEVLTELQVETFGSMDRREKTEFILEQVRLTLALGDYTLASILARKISTKVFKDEAAPSGPLSVVKEESSKDAIESTSGSLAAISKGTARSHTDELRNAVALKEEQASKEQSTENAENFDDLKLRYYELMIRIGLDAASYLDVCKYYHHVLHTPLVSCSPEKWQDILANVVYFVVLSPYSNEQSDLLHRVALDTRLENSPEMELQKELLRCFTVGELMRWPRISEIYGPHLTNTPVFSQETEDGKKRYADLQDRVIEHNIRTIASYYSRITLARLQALLDLNQKDTEKYLSELVVKGGGEQGGVWARIDRPAGIVRFKKEKKGEEILKEWSFDVGRLLSGIEKVRQGIGKEWTLVDIRE